MYTGVCTITKQKKKNTSLVVFRLGARYPVKKLTRKKNTRLNARHTIKI